MKKKAVIFDMDGVLVDSESVYLRMFRTFLEENGCEVDDHTLYKLSGANSQRTWELMARMWKEEITPQEMRAVYKKAHPVDEIPYREILFPGVRELLVWLKEQGIITAIASSSSEEAIRKMLAETELSSLFSCYVSGKWFKTSKPDPEIYLHTLQKLGLPAGDCIVVEDSAYGIQAAKAAGLTVAAVRDTKFGTDQSAADHLIDRTCELQGLMEKMTEMEQKKYWDLAAAEKKFTTPFHAREFEQYIKKDAVILDVGCGYGRTLNELHQMGFCRLSGIDFSEKMIQRGREEFPGLDLQVMKEGKIDRPDQSVDAVILFAVLTCICRDAGQRELIREIERVLRPEGILYVNDFLLNEDERNQARYAEYAPRYGTYGVFELPEGAVLRHHEETWIFELLAGFSPLQYERLQFTTMNGHISNGFYMIGRKKAENSQT